MACAVRSQIILAYIATIKNKLCGL